MYKYTTNPKVRLYFFRTNHLPMIKFFRKIRFDLLKNNKTSKYLQYAVGEIVLVVIGILVALSLNNWNEVRKSDIERNELIVAMISDFEFTQTEITIADSKMESILKKNEELLHVLKSKPFTKSRKTTNSLLNSFLFGIVFKANLTAFKAAKTNNKLRFLDSKRLLKLLDLHDNFYEDLMLHLHLSGQNFYTGSLYDLRKKAGSLSAFNNTKDSVSIFGFSDKELSTFLSNKESYAALETTYILNDNISRGLIALRRTIREILTELHKLKQS